MGRVLTAAKIEEILRICRDEGSITSDRIGHIVGRLGADVVTQFRAKKKFEVTIVETIPGKRGGWKRKLYRIERKHDPRA